MTNNKRKRPFEYNGKTYFNKKAVCEELGIDYGLVYNRTHHHKISFEEALNDYVHGRVKAKKKLPFEYNGKIYDSKKSACEELGIPYNRAFTLARQQKISFKEVLDNYHPVKVNRGRQVSIVINGKAYDSIKKACEDINISYSHAKKQRRKEGGTIQETIEKILERRTRKIERIIVKEKKKSQR